METSEDLYTEDDIVENDLEENGEHLEVQEEQGENADEDNTSKLVKVKRVVRNPQPKLNAETIKGKRGLTSLPSYFERVKYKGKGYEEQDLNLILKTYEYWCHRLFPKYPFDECIKKIEHLGNKKAVATQIKRIRHDLIVDDETKGPNDDNDSLIYEEPEERLDDLGEVISTEQLTESSMEISEELLEVIKLNKEQAMQRRRDKLREREIAMSQEIQTQTSIQVEHEIENNTEEPVLLENVNKQNEISEEQMEKIRMNKETAEKLRKEKLRQRQEKELKNELAKPCNLLSGNENGNPASSLTDSLTLQNSGCDVDSQPSSIPVLEIQTHENQETNPESDQSGGYLPWHNSNNNMSQNGGSESCLEQVSNN